MKILLNKIIPPSGFIALTAWPFIFCRNALKDVDVNHELIHGEQQKEMLVVGIVITIAMYSCGGVWWLSALAIPIYFWLYGTEWLIRLILYRNKKEAYRNISLEQEAYVNQSDFGYIPSKRRRFSWIKYVRTKTYTQQLKK